MMMDLSYGNSVEKALHSYIMNLSDTEVAADRMSRALASSPSRELITAFLRCKTDSWITDDGILVARES